jgi:ADP-heptose:LPS heptosyltransferase
MGEMNFLVVRLGSLGDIVHTMPAVAGLRQSFPEAGITWLTHPRWKVLVESCGLASEIWATETRSLDSLRQIIRGIRESHFTTAIDYQGLWKSAALPVLGGVKRRIGFSSETIREWGVPVLYTERVRCTKKHIADQNGEVSERAGARNGVARVSLGVPPLGCSRMRALLERHGVEQYIVLSPGGGWRSKCWPAVRFGALCRMIRKSLGLRCVVNYGPGESELVETLKAAAGDADPLLCNEELGPLMALLQNARCIVGGDTGPLHLAIALGTKAVGLYGPTDPVRNGPYPYNSRDIVLRAPGAVRDHSRKDETDPAMLAITVGEVFQALERRLGATA